MAEKKMVEKTPPASDEVKMWQMAFTKATFELGLTLIEEYRDGRCRDSQKTLEAIIEIFKVQPKGKERE